MMVKFEIALCGQVQNSKCECQVLVQNSILVHNDGFRTTVGRRINMIIPFDISSSQLTVWSLYFRNIICMEIYYELFCFNEEIKFMHIKF